MRSFTKQEEKNISLLTNLSVEMAYIEVTKTGLNKSIMDATASVRFYLKSKHFHDYSIQDQGVKSIKIAKVLTEYSETDTKVSLYRPVTKDGDPRIWIYGLTEYMDPNEILTLIVFNDILYVFNLTKINIVKILNDRSSFLSKLFYKISKEETQISSELLNKLVKLNKLGPIETLVDSDTGVGRTLEKYLGIEMNSSKSPDYKGIELKAYRKNRGIRKTLFAQVPNWSLSKLKSSKEILYNFGYHRGEILKLYCTITCLKRNSQGLRLRVDDDKALLFENSNKDKLSDFLVWEFEILQNRLLNKHKETFWIESKSTFIRGKEHFIYTTVMHTKSPSASQFTPLLEQGDITVDHLISEKLGKVVEKGPLFKIREKAIPMLIPDPKIYKLNNMNVL